MKSQRIAVAGGTGGIGQHVVDGLLEVKEKYSLHIIVLSRSASADLSFAGSSAPVIAVDYSDSTSIEKVLRENQIDTVLSTLSSHDPETFMTIQSNLLTAALNVPSVHRFSPSEYTHDSEALAESIPFLSTKVAIYEPLRKVKAERGSSFEFTSFQTGAFMNYFALGNPKPDGAKALGHLAPFPFVLDLKNRKADIPGDGQRRMVFTAAEDAGKFIAAVTQLDKWEERSIMKSDWLTFNEIVDMAKDLVGPIDVQYNTLEDITARIGGSPPSMANLYLFIYQAIIKGDYEQKRPFNVNDSVDVKPISMKEFLTKWWA
ncbi:NAD(P)-binding protein [Gymnopus androsaceus JB14]|uniref:NAD(P)-binding protein n=1 Tax=Gymnopus androsaceus JB14 TaxID=1447944 RepID=A0A6A4I241_9AGAR|nr:NAD(P)-binding protein [Gymnopus androsaceus JB14]